MTDTLTIVPPLSLAIQDAEPVAFAQQFGQSFERFGFAIIADHAIDPALIEHSWATTKEFLPRSAARKILSSSPTNAQLAQDQLHDPQ